MKFKDNASSIAIYKILLLASIVVFISSVGLFCIAILYIIQSENEIKMAGLIYAVIATLLSFVGVAMLNIRSSMKS